jgi:dTDP-4-dehydrorhamnose reductase
MQPKILVFGTNGQLGREIMRRAGDAATGFDRASVDISDAVAVKQAVGKQPPAAIVNAAGYTAVDQAETDIEAALRANRDGAAVLAEAASSANVPLVQISTDYVFDGAKQTPYLEDDPVAPLNVYGRSKEAGERRVRSTCPQHLILRTSWVFSPYGTNFVRTMLRSAERSELRIVDDQTGCPTAAADLAGAILAALAKAGKPGFDAWGTYHYCGADILTWHGFAKLIFEQAEGYAHPVPQDLVPIQTAAFPSNATRPAYSVLSTEKIAKTFEVRPRPLRDSLRECLDVLLGQKVL